MDHDARPGMPQKVAKVAAELNALEARGLIGRYAISGAVAFIYFTEPFDTSDLDLVVDLPVGPGGLISLTPLYTYLEDRGHRIEGEVVIIEGMPVQLLPVTSALMEEALTNALPIQVGGIAARVLDLEYLIAVALEVGRAKDLLKIRHALETSRRPVDLARLERLLQRHGLESQWRRFGGHDG